MQEVNVLPKRIELHGIGLCGIKPYIFKDKEKPYAVLTWFDSFSGPGISLFSFASSQYISYIKQSLDVNSIKRSINELSIKEDLNLIVKSLRNYLRKARKNEVCIYDKPNGLLYPIVYKHGIDTIIRQMSKTYSLLKEVTYMSIILDLVRLKAVLPNNSSSKTNILVSNLLNEIGIVDTQIKRAWLNNKQFYDNLPKKFLTTNSHIVDANSWFWKTHYIAGTIDRGIEHTKTNIIIVAYYYDRTTLERIAHDIGAFADFCRILETMIPIAKDLQIFKMFATYLYIMLKMALENFNDEEIPILQVYTPPFDKDHRWILQPQDLVYIPFPLLFQAVYTTRKLLGKSTNQSHYHTGNKYNSKTARISLLGHQKIVIANQLVVNQYAKQLLELFKNLNEHSYDSVIRIKSTTEPLFRYLWTPKYSCFVFIAENLKKYSDIYEKGTLPKLEQLYIDAGRRSAKLKYIVDGVTTSKKYNIRSRAYIETVPFQLDSKTVLLQIDVMTWLGLKEYAYKNSYLINLVDLNEYVPQIVAEEIDDTLLQLLVTPVKIVNL